MRVTELKDDYYHFIEDTYEMVGENSGKSYKLGQKVKIRVERTDKIARTIDFSIVED